MATRIKINNNVKYITNTWLYTQVFPVLNKSGISVYCAIIDSPKENGELEITQKILDKYKITKRQYYLGLNELKNKHYLVYDMNNNVYNFYYQPRVVDMF